MSSRPGSLAGPVEAEAGLSQGSGDMCQIEEQPARLLAKIPVPTTPRIKAGPELLQKASSRSASVFEHWPFSYRAIAVRAPPGTPP